MKISILLPIHRYGGCDIWMYGLERQTFPKEDYELILCDRLYDFRKDEIKVWSKENNINVVHFEPQNKSIYHVHSSVLNECLKMAIGKYSVIIGDYSYFEPEWLSIHYEYNKHGYCLSAPQKIYCLPKLKTNLERPISIFDETFDPEMFKILPSWDLDPKIDIPIGGIIGGKYWYNRNESFITEKAREIGGWDERYDNSVGPSNLEFGLRMEYEAKCKIATDNRAKICRILSYSIPPFTKFISSEHDVTKNKKYFDELLDKYEIKL